MELLTLVGTTGSATAARTVVKICGIQELSEARVAAEAGADLLGFILAPSRRRTTPERIRGIYNALRASGRTPLFVGVFVNESAESINDAVERAGLDVVQLCGEESPELLDEIDVPAIRSLRPASQMGEREVRRQADLWLDRTRPATVLHLDGHLAGSHGGTGTLADWSLARRLVADYPLLLAGGLTPANVAKAIATVNPCGVDVSSGVEHGGRKQPERIVAFIAAARAQRAWSP